MIDWSITSSFCILLLVSSSVTCSTISYNDKRADGMEPHERCRLCPEGSKYELVDAVLPSMVLPGYNETLTCRNLQLAMLALDANSDRCRDLQASNGGYCACVDTGPLYQCSFCPDDSVPANIDGVVSTPLKDECRTLYNYVEYLPPDQCQKEIFTAVTSYADECGCPSSRIDQLEENAIEQKYNNAGGTEETQNRDETTNELVTPIRIEDIPPQPETVFRQTTPCGFCPDLSFPPDPSITLDLYQGRTCGEYAQFINGLKKPECQLQSERGTFELFAYQCGCPGSSPPACSLRENSELCTVSLLDSVTESCECYNFCDGEFVGCTAWPGDFMGDSCQGTPISGCNYASAIDDSGSCHMCPDFSNNISNPDAIIPPFSGVVIPGNPTPTCQDVIDYLESPPEDGDADMICDTVQNRLAYYCGCEGTFPSCTLCPGGVAPSFADKIATGDVTCAEFAGTVTTWEQSTCELGQEYLGVMAARCGCVTSSWPQCPIQQSPQLCTANLLRQADERCECYNFCGDQFVGCADYPGQLLDEADCPEGVTLISGCNKALATSHRCGGGRTALPCPETSTFSATRLRTRR